MAPTYKDIQRITGLSLSTISKYFNGKGVSDQNRAAISQAVEQLDYRVNVFARSLKSRRSRAIGVLIPELNGAFNATIISEVGYYLRQHGYGMLVCDCHSDETLQPELAAFLLDRQVDGMVVIPSGRDTSQLVELAGEVPMVVIDRPIGDFRGDTVVLDNWKAGSMAAEELVRAGHTRVGFISGPRWYYSMHERKWGYWRTLQRYGVKPRSEYFAYGEFQVESGREVTLHLLKKRNPPTALFATNDLLTLGMVVAVQELGLSVPEDISLIGFDNLLIEHVLGKALTMIAQPYSEIGEQAALFILSQLEDPAEPKKKRVAMMQPILHRGMSVGEPRKTIVAGSHGNSP